MVLKFLKSKLTTHKQTSNHDTGILNKLKHKIRIFFSTDDVIDDEFFDQIEEHLLTADLGLETCTQVMTHLKNEHRKKLFKDTEQLLESLKHILLQLIEPLEQPLIIPPTSKPFIILMIGINGAGKTTTIGKLAHIFTQENKKVMLAAGDTYRAAAIEQLCAWGERNHIPVIKQHHGADPAAVIHDAIESAQAKDIDILLADTAGRLHTKENLMLELSKIVKVIKKKLPIAPQETLLIIDATIGQNSLSQAAEFAKTTPITGIIVTKLDSSSKGGIIFAIGAKLKIPIRFIGVGESLDDLQPFNAREYIEAILQIEPQTDKT